MELQSGATRRHRLRLDNARLLGRDIVHFSTVLGGEVQYVGFRLRTALRIAAIDIGIAVVVDAIPADFSDPAWLAVSHDDRREVARTRRGGACVFRTRVAVIARRRIVRVRATRRRVTHVHRAEVAVVTHDSGVCAGSWGTAPVHRAHTAIIAGETKSYTQPGLARLLDRARVAVITHYTRKRSVLTARRRIARVRRTNVDVVAIGSLTPDANANTIALVTSSAGTSVAAQLTADQNHKHAARRRVTHVGRAEVAVVTGERDPTRTTGSLALVADRTRVAVIARRRIVRVHATRLRVTRVGSTEIAIVTDERGAFADTATVTRVDGRTQVAVGAPYTYEDCVHATRRRVARSTRALVAVLAEGFWTPHADGNFALVADRTRVAVVTRRRVVRVHATRLRVARVGSTEIAIVTDERLLRAWHARSHIT